MDPTLPHIESTSGLGATPSFNSSRAKAVQRYNEFEEENFTRLVMKKRDMKRRARDEEALALGGSVGGKGRRGGGLEEEFADVLKDVERAGAGPGRSGGDAYEELRRRGKKGDVLERSRARTSEVAFPGDTAGDSGRQRKRGRFEKEARVVKRKLAKARK
jgi:U3 small nucleolar ribonucleoprotein protein LCP5